MGNLCAVPPSLLSLLMILSEIQYTYFELEYLNVCHACFRLIFQQVSQPIAGGGAGGIFLSDLWPHKLVSPILFTLDDSLRRNFTQKQPTSFQTYPQIQYPQIPFLAALSARLKRRGPHFAVLPLGLENLSGAHLIRASFYTMGALTLNTVNIKSILK